MSGFPEELLRFYKQSNPGFDYALQHKASEQSAKAKSQSSVAQALQQEALEHGMSSAPDEKVMRTLLNPQIADCQILGMYDPTVESAIDSEQVVPETDPVGVPVSRKAQKISSKSHIKQQ